MPLVFGYVTYAPQGVGFSDAIRAPGGKGGALGGTGLALTRRADPTPALLDHLGWLMSEATQRDFLPRHDGQPSARAAWTDGGVNDAWADFYRATLDGAETALLRPRFDGYVAFQTAASDRLRVALAGREPPHRTLAALRALWTDARARARGDLDDRR